MPALKQRHQNGGRSSRSGTHNSSSLGSKDPKGQALQSRTAKDNVSIRSIFTSWIYLLGFLVALVSIGFWGDTRLPTPKSESFNPYTGITQYSEDNARKITKTLAEDIGLRLVGTIQMVDAEEYLIREIKSMQEQALIATARGAKDLPKFEYWTQVNDGSHRFDFMSKGKKEWKEVRLKGKRNSKTKEKKLTHGNYFPRVSGDEDVHQYD